jgi:hypothetical protein
VTGVHFQQSLDPLLVGIDDVRQHPRNPRNGDVDAITESIVVNGLYRPVYAQRSTCYLLAGNHVWQALKSLGVKQVPVVWLDVDDATAARILLADNRLADRGGYDDGLLLELLSEIDLADSLLGTGYLPGDLAALRALTEEPLNTEDLLHQHWPTLCVQLPPNSRAAYYRLTERAVGDRERFELLLRLAGADLDQDYLS